MATIQFFDIDLAVANCLKPHIPRYYLYLALAGPLYYLLTLALRCPAYVMTHEKCYEFSTSLEALVCRLVSLLDVKL